MIPVLLVLAVIAVLYLVFGMFIPYNLSADSDFLNFIGMIVIAATVVFVMYILKIVYNALKTAPEIILPDKEDPRV